MYARVIVSQVKNSAMIEDHLQVIKDIESILEQQYDDLTDVLHLVNRSTGEVIDIFLWETETAANQPRIEELSDVLKEQFAKGQQFLATSPTDELYEVLL